MCDPQYLDVYAAVRVCRGTTRPEDEGREDTIECFLDDTNFDGETITNGFTNGFVRRRARHRNGGRDVARIRPLSEVNGVHGGLVDGEFVLDGYP